MESNKYKVKIKWNPVDGNLPETVEVSSSQLGDLTGTESDEEIGMYIDNWLGRAYNVFPSMFTYEKI